LDPTQPELSQISTSCESVAPTVTFSFTVTGFTFRGEDFLQSK